MPGVACAARGKSAHCRADLALRGSGASSIIRPMQTSEESAWVTLTRTPALDLPTLARALEIFGSAQGITEASDASRERAGMSAAAREFLSSAAAAPLPKEWMWLESPRHHVVPFTDPRYPAALLRATERYPIALYVVGNADALNDPQLAIVGSRNPTPQG